MYTIHEHIQQAIISWTERAMPNLLQYILQPYQILQYILQTSRILQYVLLEHVPIAIGIVLDIIFQ